MRISHILVQQKFEAEDILRLLKAGKPFESLAKKFSQCPSAEAGGDLGDLQGKKLDEDFADVARALRPGQTSGIVRTRFGYHILFRQS